MLVKLRLLPREKLFIRQSILQALGYVVIYSCGCIVFSFVLQQLDRLAVRFV